MYISLNIRGRRFLIPLETYRNWHGIGRDVSPKLHSPNIRYFLKFLMNSSSSFPKIMAFICHCPTIGFSNGYISSLYQVLGFDPPAFHMIYNFLPSCWGCQARKRRIAQLQQRLSSAAPPPNEVPGANRTCLMCACVM